MSKSFFLLDDDADDRELFVEALSLADATAICYTASKAEEALKRLKSDNISVPDFIFLDINLPDLSGWECLIQLKSMTKYKQVPVIMYSTSSHEKDVKIAQDLGAFYFLTKPDDFRHLQNFLTIIVQTPLSTLKEALQTESRRISQDTN
ncbi:response regulator [Cytophagaceae bacterium YF14B1]|uniref:Response regulator n=1 Tax=Xanthocytophaga flava TaxID=3048013 RepID=A0AAE3QUW4_9BACT|nr:response regulator [Xanthocytophaga flavus]MDJ1482993.1 response regulator [Xanthocytophaga flavus]